MFLLNLLFNAVMWGLFTRALTLAPSAIRVNVINTASNFLITAILGLVIFSETLPALWLVGAAMLVAGSVIIGARDEKGQSKGQEAHGEPMTGVGAEGVELDGVGVRRSVDSRGRDSDSSRDSDGSRRRRPKDDQAVSYRDAD